MPYTNKTQRNEYAKLVMRKRRHSRLDVPNKTIIELMSKKKLIKEIKEVN